MPGVASALLLKWLSLLAVIRTKIPLINIGGISKYWIRPRLTTGP
jgi:hypothetical protein